MSFGGLLSCFYALTFIIHSLTTLAYFLVPKLPFAHKPNVRAETFVGIGRPLAGASGGNRTLLKKARGVVVTTIATALSAPLMLCMALAIKTKSDGPMIFHRKGIGVGGSIWKFRATYAERPDPNAARQTSLCLRMLGCGYRSEPRTRSSRGR
jgi:Sugar transferases involved in lipopolysaccharide synthesis